MEQCDFPRCRNFADFGYMGHNICYTHWGELCEADSKTKKRLLKKIGLKRDKSGRVVSIKDDNDGKID